MPEPKTIRTWLDRGYIFVRRGECPACHKGVEFWLRKQGGLEIMLDPDTLETHFSGCSRAKAYRAAQRAEAGVL